MATKKKPQFEQAYFTAEEMSNQKNEEGSIIAPVATNSMESYELFVERKEYKEFAYPYNDEEVPSPIDIWYNRGLYGKIDTDYNSVFVDEKYLKKLPSEQGDTFAINFVVDAFSDLQNYMHVAANKGQIFTTDTNFLAMEPKQGWTSVQNRYAEHVSVLYKGFADTFLEQGSNKKELFTFKDFMKLFQTYLETIQPNFPLTRTGYITTGFCPITTTGIVIELEVGNHGDDQKKYNDYIEDKNFVFFARAARKFGFWVDKNAPWRLIADLKSEVMQKYMERYPEEPVEPPVAGDEPQVPCASEDIWFGNYINQKVEFGAGKVGYISGFADECDTTLHGNKLTKFTIQETSDDFDIDIVQKTEVFRPIIKFDYSIGATGSATNKAKIVQIWAPEAHRVEVAESGQMDLQKILYLVAPLPDSKRGNATRSGGAFEEMPIRLDASESRIEGLNSSIGFYNWEIVDAPADSSASFVDEHGVSTEHLGIPDSQIYFLPDKVGAYTFSVQLIDSEGNRGEHKYYAYLNVCRVEWLDVVRAFAMEPNAVRAYGPEWLYSKLALDIKRVWDEWTRRSDDSHHQWWLRFGPGWSTGMTDLGYDNGIRSLVDKTDPYFEGAVPFPYKASPFGMKFLEAASPPCQIWASNPHGPYYPGINGDEGWGSCGKDRNLQLPLTGELEFLRERLGWDIVGKYPMLVEWIRWLTKNTSGEPSPDGHDWKTLLRRAEVKPDKYRPSFNGLDFVDPGYLETAVDRPYGFCEHNFVYNQFQTRGFNQGGGSQLVYSFPSYGSYGSLLEKIERWEWSPNLFFPAGGLMWPMRIFPFRPPGNTTYNRYRVPATANLGSLNEWEKGLPDAEMEDMFGGSMADLFEIMLVISQDLCGGVGIETLFLTDNIRSEEDVSVQNSVDWLSDGARPTRAAFAREPFSGMGVVPFKRYGPLENPGKRPCPYDSVLREVLDWLLGGIITDCENWDEDTISRVGGGYSSDFVIKRMEWGSAYAIAQGATLPNGWTPFEFWKHEVYDRQNETPHALGGVFLESQMSKDRVKPWMQGAGGVYDPRQRQMNNLQWGTLEHDEIIQYIIERSDNLNASNASIVALILALSGAQCEDSTGDEPANDPTDDPTDDPALEPGLTSFDSAAIYYSVAAPDLIDDWKLAHGGANEYSIKRQEFVKAMNNWQRLHDEWQFRVDAHAAWQVAHDEWLTLPRLSFDNLYLHNPPIARSPGEYIVSFEYDIPTLQSYILNFYNSYVSQNQTIVTSEFNKCGDGVIQKVRHREMISVEDFDDRYSDLFWLEFYFAMRLSESGRTLTKSEKDFMIKQIRNLYSQALGGVGNNSIANLSPEQRKSLMLKSLQKIASETKGIYEDKSDLTVQGKDDKILNNFKTYKQNDPENKRLTLEEFYDIVLPDGSFKP